MALDRSPESFSPQKLTLPSLFLLFQLVTPQGGASFDPKGIIWKKHYKGPLQMLLAKYQSSRPPSFRYEVFWSWSSLVLVPTCDPRGRASFNPIGIIWRNLVEVYKEMRYKKYQAQDLFVSEKKNLKMGFSIPTCDHKGRASFDPGGIKWTNLVEVYKEMPYTKYQSSRPSSFRKEEFWGLPSLFLCSNLWPRRRSFDPRGIILTHLVEIHKEMLYTTYQSSRPSSFKEEEFWNCLSLF